MPSGRVSIRNVVITVMVSSLSTETISITETIAPVQTTDSQVRTVITGTLIREVPLNGRNPLHPELAFVELAGFHDEPHALESCDIGQGIAVDRDEIRFKPRRDGADQVLQIHRLGAVRGWTVLRLLTQSSMVETSRTFCSLSFRRRRRCASNAPVGWWDNKTF